MDAMSLNLQSTMKELEVKEEPIENCEEGSKQINFNCSVKEEQEDPLVDFEAFWNTQDLKGECNALELEEQQKFKEEEEDEEVKPPFAVFLQPNEENVESETIFDKDPLMSDFEDVVISGNPMVEVAEPATRRHRQISPEGGAASVSCPSPNETFPRLDVRQRKRTKAWQFSCDTCNAGFNREDHFARHLRRHKRDQPFKCAVCQVAFSESTSLAMHYRTHYPRNRFKCKVCKVFFTQKSMLVRHRRIHTNSRTGNHPTERPFKCDICKMAFAYSSSLTVHNRRHTGYKPYTCNVCQCVFSHSAILSAHKRLHTGENTSKGDECDPACSLPPPSPGINARTPARDFSSVTFVTFPSQGPLNTRNTLVCTLARGLSGLTCVNAQSPGPAPSPFINARTPARSVSSATCTSAHSASPPPSTHARTHTGENPF